MTRDNYIIRVAGSIGGQRCFWRKGAVAEGLKHIQVSLWDVRHLPDDDVTPFSLAQRRFHLSDSCVLSFLCLIILSISCKKKTHVSIMRLRIHIEEVSLFFAFTILFFQLSF